MIESLKHLNPKTLAVKLSKPGERILRKRHPWIFSESIEKSNKEGEAGDIAVIFSHNTNKPIGVGLYDPHSPIRIKMLHFGSGAKIDKDFFSEKIQQAYEFRKDLLKTNTNSYRLIFGENDGFPSFIADVYADVLVVKLYSAIWLPFFGAILTELIKVSKCESAVLRFSRKVRKYTDSFQLKDGTIIYGELKDENVHFIEHGVHFSANVIKGHKTGFFLDHRLNRKRVGEMAKDKRVLDVFAYAGGFSVHALVGGAKKVTSLDISKQALELAKANAELNEYNGLHSVIAGDAFEELRNLQTKEEKFDLIVIDPPSFAKRASEEFIALKKYKELATLGASLTAKKGILILASCSSRVNAESFFDINAQALDATSRKWSLIEKTFHDVDHHISFPEGAYLKCGYYQLD